MAGVAMLQYFLLFNRDSKLFAIRDELIIDKLLGRRAKQ